MMSMSLSGRLSPRAREPKSARAQFDFVRPQAG
jgi:hypothetical protein